uniref:Conotoxin Tx3.5-a n=2 Tax=Conus textile TaxID=6494 RepID=M3F_CONTE|nr:RecName: Full=Conotoxin Tx3.5-a; Contains: RecName: Full=Conotoxin tx3f; AltName: Full=Conotoxin Tx3.5-b; Contains: RecName: Full=Truncated conotoxin tx3f; Flags: Precursor [Conus textile]
MSKLGVLLTICLLLFPLTALPLDGDQPADQAAERMQAEQHPLFDQKRRCCKFPCPDSCRYLCCG